ncbi:LOW QUALITY PROTEIN: hypothetical protein TorRG33x02_310800, partial [Trema orientale]
SGSVSGSGLKAQIWVLTDRGRTRKLPRAATRWRNRVDPPGNRVLLPLPEKSSPPIFELHGVQHIEEIRAFFEAYLEKIIGSACNQGEASSRDGWPFVSQTTQPDPAGFSMRAKPHS